MADPSPWIAKCPGCLLGSRKLREQDPVGRFQWCFLADALCTIVFEDSLKSSGPHVMDQINKAVLLDCQGRVVHQVFVPAQHESGWATLVASYQRAVHDQSRVAAGEMSTGLLLYVQSLELRAVLLFKGRVCVRPRSVLSVIYEVEAGFNDLPLLEGSPSQWWADWGGVLEAADLPQPELNSLMWARSGPYLRVRPEGAYCPFCTSKVSVWAHHFRICSSLIFAAAYGLLAVRSELILEGWQPQVTGIWSHVLCREGESLRLILCGERDPREAPATGHVSWSGVVSYNRSKGKSTPSVTVSICTALQKVYSAALLKVVRDQDRPAMLRSLMFSLVKGQSLPWAVGVLAAITSATTGVSWHVSVPEVSPLGVELRSPHVLGLLGFTTMADA